MAHIERDNVLGERVGAGSGFEREFDAEEQEGLAERWSYSAVVRTNGCVEDGLQEGRRHIVLAVEGEGERARASSLRAEPLTGRAAQEQRAHAAGRSSDAERREQLAR